MSKISLLASGAKLLLNVTKFGAKGLFKGTKVGGKVLAFLPKKGIGFAIRHPILAYTGYKAAGAAGGAAKDIAKPVVKGFVLFELFKFFFDFLRDIMSPEEFAEIVGPIRDSLKQIIEPMAGPATAAIMKPIDDMLQYDTLNGKSKSETEQLAKETADTVVTKLESANAEAVAREAEHAGYDEFGDDPIPAAAKADQFNHDAQALLDATTAYTEEMRAQEANQSEAEITAGIRDRSGRLTTFLSAVQASASGNALPASGLSCLTGSAVQSSNAAPSADLADVVLDKSRERKMKAELDTDGLAASVSDTRSSFSVGGIGGA